jgi:L-ascorbate metabolism protein UlaG (beta-lactamase superfamily)
MRIQWYGQSAFSLTGDNAEVFIDPFADMTPLADRGVRWDYPAISARQPHVLLITHEHLDHNGVEAIEGEPTILRSTAGKLESPIGEIVAVASEHDDAAGTERGPNTIFVFTLDGVRTAHFGDFGQGGLREDQAAAIGDVDLLFLPVGGGPTTGAAQAREIVDRLRPRWVVPMHYRTHRIGFLEPADEFLDTFEQVHRADDSNVDTADLPRSEEPIAVVPAAP